MRAIVITVALAALALIQTGCAADLHAGPRNGGVDAGAAIGAPLYIPTHP